MAEKITDILNTAANLPKKITDVTDSISNGATKVHDMTTKMDTALRGIPTYNPVSGAIKGGLTKVTGAIDAKAASAESAANKLNTTAHTVATAITPVATAAKTVSQAVTDLQNCLQVVDAASLVVDAIVNTATGHFHPKDVGKAFQTFDDKWDSWARVVNKTYETLSPSGKTNVLMDLANSNFSSSVVALGSDIKNESAGIFNGIADFESSIQAFRGSYRDPIQAAKKIETGVKGIINATEKVANSINNMIKTYQKGVGATVTGNPVLNYIGNLHNTPAVSALNKVLTVGGGAATLWSDAGSLAQAWKSKDLKTIYKSAEKTVKDASTIIKGLKYSDAATKTSALAQNASASSGQSTMSNLTSSSGSKQSASNNGSSGGQQKNQKNNSGGGSASTDSYVCSGAIMKCTMGTSPARLTVLPIRTVFLTGQPMANISDHQTMVNLAPFGLCRSMGFPATASATASAMGTLTPMPCMHNTPFPWMGGKNDYLVKGQPALLKSSTCQCMWGGTISIINDGQNGTGQVDMSKKPAEPFSIKQVNRRVASLASYGAISNTSKNDDISNQNLKTTNNKNAQSLAGSIVGIDTPAPLLPPTPYTEAEKHYQELQKIDSNTIFEGLPISWKTAYDRAFKSAKEKYSKKDISKAFSDIELAHNIYALATSDEAKKLGYNNISYKMPHQVFNIADKVPGFLDKMPKKEFWDSFDKYVPLYTNIHNPVGCNAYFSTNYNSVVISMLDEDNITRMTDSDWYKAGLLHHEYGHAQDHLRGWSSSKEFETVFNEFINEVTEKKVVIGNKEYYEVEYKLHELIKKYRDEHKYTKDVEEKLGGLSDSIQAAFYAKGIKHGGYPRGHFSKDKTGKEYFEDKELRMAEFIAHSSENYWSENDLFKSLCPETYEKMREVIKNSLDKKQ